MEGRLITMTRIDIFSGFLGAGKTTLIRKLIAEGYQNEKLVLIENEFGEIAIDGGFLQDAGVQITEMNSGCICCTLVGDFTKALKKVMDDYAPDRILIERQGQDVRPQLRRVFQRPGCQCRPHRHEPHRYRKARKDPRGN